MSKDSGSDVISIAELVQEMMERPLEGRVVPNALKVSIQNQKMQAQRIFDEILAQIATGKTVKVKNFGSFSMGDVKSNARNPKTGGIAEVKKPKRLRFSSTAKADDTLND